MWQKSEVNIFGYDKIQDLLSDILYKRSKQNSRYSLRAFARDLEISPSRLSEIMNSKKYSASRATIEKISTNLNLNKAEQQHLLEISLSNKNNQKQIRKIAETKLSRALSQKSYHEIKHDPKSHLEHWYYPALIQLISCQKKISTQQISRYLNISEAQIYSALKALIESKVVTQHSENRYEVNFKLIKIESNTPSHFIQKYHVEMNKLAQKAMTTQKIDKRKFITSVVCFEKKQLEEARREIEYFMAYFNKKYASPEAGDSVYCANINFFEVSHD